MTNSFPRPVVFVYPDEDIRALFLDMLEFELECRREMIVEHNADGWEKAGYDNEAEFAESQAVAKRFVEWLSKIYQEAA